MKKIMRYLEDHFNPRLMIEIGLALIIVFSIVYYFCPSIPIWFIILCIILVYGVAYLGTIIK